LASGLHPPHASSKALRKPGASTRTDGISPGARPSSANSPAPNETAQVFTNATGPLPRTDIFASGGGTLVITASGTAYTASTGKLGMNVIVNGVTNGVCSIFANATATPLAFCPVQFVMRNIPAGTNTLILSPLTGTLSDANDVFNVTVMELPF